MGEEILIGKVLAGRVERFDPDPSRRFGFIIPDDGSYYVYFHVNEYYEITVGLKLPEFTHNIQPPFYPRPNDRIVFFLSSTPPSPGHKWKVSKWCYETSLIIAEGVIRSRIIYRIMKAAGNEPKELWRGSNLREKGLENYYNPKLDSVQNNTHRRVWWELSYDSGKTWTFSKCPRDYKNQFNMQTGERVLPLR